MSETIQAVAMEAATAQLRADSIRCTHRRVSSGHLTSGMSAADLMSVLLTSHLKYDFDNPTKSNNRPSDLLRIRLPGPVRDA